MSPSPQWVSHTLNRPEKYTLYGPPDKHSPGYCYVATIELGFPPCKYVVTISHTPRISHGYSTEFVHKATIKILEHEFIELTDRSILSAKEFAERALNWYSDTSQHRERMRTHMAATFNIDSEDST